MKIFNTMNKLYTSLAMTVAISMGTSAQADVVYSGSFQSDAWDYDFPGFHTSDTQSWSDEESISMYMLPLQGVLNGYSHDNGVNLHWSINSGNQEWQYSWNMDMTFDTATVITIQTAYTATGSGFLNISGTADGTYTVQAGETFSFNQYMHALGVGAWGELYDPNWPDGGGNLMTSITFAAVPAPGALALLGLTAIRTRRRRK